MKLINVGFGNVVIAGRIECIKDSGTSPVRRTIRGARDSGRLIDVTLGRKSRSAVFVDSGHVILSSVHPRTLGNRLKALGVSLKKL